MISRWSASLLILCTLAALTGCDSPADRAAKEPLLAAEKFDWCKQPISFQPPPADWRRDRYNQGGRLGVDFIHTDSVGERIYLADYYRAGQKFERADGNIRNTLEEFLDQARIRPETWTVCDSAWTTGDTTTAVAGTTAYTVRFGMRNRGYEYVGREHYFMHNNYLFVASFLGLEENLPIFERVVASITFPEPEVP